MIYKDFTKLNFYISAVFWNPNQILKFFFHIFLIFFRSKIGIPNSKNHNNFNDAVKKSRISSTLLLNEGWFLGSSITSTENDENNNPENVDTPTLSLKLKSGFWVQKS